MRTNDAVKRSLRVLEEKRLLADINRLSEEIRERAGLRDAKIRILTALRRNVDPPIEGEDD